MILGWMRGLKAIKQSTLIVGADRDPADGKTFPLLHKKSFNR